MDGVAVEICEKYQNHYAQPKIIKLKHLSQKIITTDTKFVNNLTQKMGDALNAAK